MIVQPIVTSTTPEYLYYRFNGQVFSTPGAGMTLANLFGANVLQLRNILDGPNGTTYRFPALHRSRKINSVKLTFQARGFYRLLSVGAIAAAYATTANTKWFGFLGLSTGMSIDGEKFPFQFSGEQDSVEVGKSLINEIVMPTFDSFPTADIASITDGVNFIPDPVNQVHAYFLGITLEARFYYG